MYARTTTVRGDPMAVNEGIEYVRDAVWPMLQHMSGCVGMSMLAERDAGRCIITTAWAAEEAMRASAESVRDMRSKSAEMLRADAIDVNEWEIAVLHRAHAAGPDACARVLWAEMDPARLDAMIEGFRTTMMPNMEAADGFCSVSMMCNRNNGRLTWTVTLENRAALDGTRERAMAAREQFAPAMGMQITEVAEFEVAIAHLRVPEMA